MQLKMNENETMSPRERVETALAIKEPDRVPIVASFHCTPALLTGMDSPVFKFQILKILSTDPETRYLLSEETATDKTGFLCPFKVR